MAATVALGGQVVNAVSNLLIGGATVSACDGADAACAAPLAVGTTDASMDPGVTMVVPTPGPAGFEGYFRTTGANLVPTDHYYNPFSKTYLSLRLRTVSPAEVQTAAAISGVVVDPSRGQLIVEATHCPDAFVPAPFGGPAPGVTLTADTADAATAVVYTDGQNFPDPSLTQTTNLGGAVIFNVPPGAVLITMTVVADGSVAAVFPANVKAGELAHLTISPTP
ncbi:MAG: hypothetical protein IT373_38050 [Polyangiaceae bacterium]|nr:hypothetical protein [Polyangiaceae bacterium]